MSDEKKVSDIIAEIKPAVDKEFEKENAKIIKAEKKDNKPVKGTMLFWFGMTMIALVFFCMVFIFVKIERDRYMTQYQRALEYYDAGNFTKAKEILISISNFSDMVELSENAEDWIKKCKVMIKEEKKAKKAYKYYKHGDVVKAYKYASMSEHYITDVLDDKTFISDIEGELYGALEASKKKTDIP